MGYSNASIDSKTLTGDEIGLQNMGMWPWCALNVVRGGKPGGLAF